VEKWFKITYQYVFREPYLKINHNKIILKYISIPKKEAGNKKKKMSHTQPLLFRKHISKGARSAKTIIILFSFLVQAKCVWCEHIVGNI
jgi:hypothetical protein